MTSERPSNCAAQAHGIPYQIKIPWTGALQFSKGWRIGTLDEIWVIRYESWVHRS